MFVNILVPFDQSEAATRAMEIAVDLVSDGAKVTVFECFDAAYCTDPTMEVAERMAGVLHEAEVESALEDHRADVEAKNLGKLSQMAEQAGKKIECASTSAVGPAAFEIARYAEKNGCDLIVMGRRGLGAVRAMLGSVSQKVSHESDLPVLLVK